MCKTQVNWSSRPMAGMDTSDRDHCPENSDCQIARICAICVPELPPGQCPHNTPCVTSSRLPHSACNESLALPLQSILSLTSSLFQLASLIESDFMMFLPQDFNTSCSFFPRLTLCMHMFLRKPFEVSNQKSRPSILLYS